MDIFSKPANAIHVDPPKPVLFCNFSTLLFFTVTPVMLSLIAVFNAYYSGLSTAIPSDNPGDLLL